MKSEVLLGGAGGDMRAVCLGERGLLVSEKTEAQEQRFTRSG